MGSARVRFESIDESTQRQAQALARKLRAAGGKRLTVQMEGQLAELFERIAGVIAEVDGLAYGGLAAELSPEQAGRILGISRPLVVRRMDDGRLPFTYVGAHRRCNLEDVLRLKVREEKQAEALRELGEGIEDLDFRPPRS
jgi:excisionase family DNA binding protein